LVKCSLISEKHTGHSFRVTEFVQIDAQVIWRKKCVIYVGWFENVWPIAATEGSKRVQDWPEPTEIQDFQQQPFFPDVASGRYANNVDTAVKLCIA
jgi:hypothetical protein